MRVVVDANIVASGIFWSGPPNQILRSWLAGHFVLVVSAPILAEYIEVLGRLCGTRDAGIFSKWNRLLTEFSEILEPREAIRICRDPDDDKYLEAAVGGRAKAVVSGDKDLLVLQKVRGIPILSPREFLERFQRTWPPS